MLTTCDSRPGSGVERSKSVRRSAYRPMRTVTVTPEDRHRLEAIVMDRKRRRNNVARAKVILATAEGRGTNEVMRRSGPSKPARNRGHPGISLSMGIKP